MKDVIEAKIKDVSGIQTDGNGFQFVELELDNGVTGFYPGQEATLNGLLPGTTITYQSLKKYNMKDKISGLVVKKEAEVPKEEAGGSGVILEISEVNLLKGFFYRKIKLSNGAEANAISKNANSISNLRPGNLISYTGVTDAGEHGMFFDNLKKEFLYNIEDRRNLSIVRQSSLKLATELFCQIKVCNTDFKLPVKKGLPDWEAISNEIIGIADKFVDYSLVD